MQSPKGTLRQAEGRSDEMAWNAGSIPRRSLPSLKSPELSYEGCKAQDIEAGCLCLSQKGPTRKTEPTGGVGGLEGLRGSLRQTEGQSGETAGNAGILSGRPFLSQKPPPLPGVL